MKECTIKDVAKAASVSISTVSKALNGTGIINTKTRDKIIDTAKKMNYYPNSIAVSMVAKKSKTIAVMVPYISSTFYADVIQGVETSARLLGYSILVYCTDETESKERELFSSSLGKFVDGVVAVSSVNKHDIYEKYHKPVVLIDRNVDESNLDCVMIDNFESTHILAKRLITAGHKRIAYLSGSLDTNVGRDRLMGFEQAMHNAGLPVDSSLVRLESWHEPYGYSFMHEYAGMKDKPSAILAGNGSICDGLLIAGRELGIVFGEDVSLASVDDSILATFNEPKITVIQRETTGMGTMAMSILHEKLCGKPEAAQFKKIILPVRLVERGSIKNISI